MIEVSISSDEVLEGKTTLAVELAKFIAERTGTAVEIVSDTFNEALIEKYSKDNSLEGMQVKVIDLDGTSEADFKKLATTTHVTVISKGKVL